MELTRQAQRKCLTEGKDIELRDFQNLQKAEPRKKFRDKDGKYKRRITLKNFDSKLKVGTLPYSNYADWRKMGGWNSDQWTRFELQTNMEEQAVKATGDTFYSMADQQNAIPLDMPLHPLDIEKDIMDDFTVVLVGRRRSGKTYLSRWLMYHMRFRFPFGIVITGTKQNNFWAQYVPEEFIHDIEDINMVLDMVFARQTYIKAHPELGIDPRMFIILDDVLSDKFRIRFSVSLSKIFTDGRHNDVFTLITLQDAKGIPPDLRENTDLCLLFRVYEGGRQKVIKEEWLSYIHDMGKQTTSQGTQQVLHGEPHTETNLRGGGRAPLDKTPMQIKFFWKNTGLMDKKTCENFKETQDTTDEDRENAVPQAIAVLQARTTENLQEVFKRAVAEDPGPFILGDLKYYKAAETGQYGPIINSYHKFKRRGKRRVKKRQEGKDESEDSSSD